MSFNTEAIQKYWKYLESRSIAPEKISKISIIKFEDLKEACDKKNEFYIKSLIKKMYNGSAFIVRGAAKKKLKDTILKLAKKYDSKEKPSFHKMLDGTPNFHRIYDKNITKKYSLYAIKHSYFFIIGILKVNLKKNLKLAFIDIGGT